MPRAHRAARLVGASLFTAVITLGAGLAVSRAQAPTTESKDQTLFVGMDLALPRDGEFCRVVGATSKGFIVQARRQRLEVPFANASELRITKGVKLSSLSATVSKVKTENFSRAAAKEQFRAMNTYVLMNDLASQAADRAQGELTRADLGGGSNLPDPRSGITVSPLESAVTNFNSVQPGVDSSRVMSSSFLFDNMRGRGGDTVAATFEVAAERRIEHPYVLLVVDFAGEKPGQIMRGVAARTLDFVDATPRALSLEVQVDASRLRAGAEVKNVYVNVYADGQEVATNLSERKVSLTKQEAYQYYLLEYLGTHKGETRAPAPMLLTPRSELRRPGDPAQLKQAVYAAVDKQGTLVALSTDEAGQQKVGTEVEALLKSFRFMPALEKGVPVDGRLKLTPAELLQ
jgi:hypothetical protein